LASALQFETDSDHEEEWGLSQGIPSGLVGPHKKMSGFNGKRHGEIQCGRNSNPDKV